MENLPTKPSHESAKGEGCQAPGCDGMAVAPDGEEEVFVLTRIGHAALDWLHVGFSFWFHPITISVASVVVAWVVLWTAGFSHAVGIEREGLRHATGERIQIAHKTVLVKHFMGYRIVMERANHGVTYTTSELVQNEETKTFLGRSLNGQRREMARRLEITEAERVSTDTTGEHDAEALKKLDRGLMYSVLESLGISGDDGGGH